jgi:YVTN family beta-propeller protein
VIGVLSSCAHHPLDILELDGRALRIESGIMRSRSVLIGFFAFLLCGFSPASLPSLELLPGIKSGKAPYALRVSRDHRLFVANFASDEVGVLNLGDTRGRMQMMYAGPEPIDLALSPTEDQLWVVNKGAGMVTIMSTSEFRPLDNIKMGGEPVAIAMDPTSTRVFVANWGRGKFGRLDVIDFKTHEVLKAVKMGVRPLAVAFDSVADVVYVANIGSDSITRVKFPQYEAEEFPCVETPNGLALSQDGKRLYVTGASASFVALIDTATMKEIRRASVGQGPFGIAIHPDGWVATADREGGTVSILTPDLTGLQRLKIGKSPNHVVFSHDGSTAYVTLEKENKVGLIRLQ